MINHESELKLTNCTFLSNEGIEGGAIYYKSASRSNKNKNNLILD